MVSQIKVHEAELEKLKAEHNKLQEEAAAFRSSADAKVNEFQLLNAELASVKAEAQHLKAEMDTKSSENQRTYGVECLLTSNQRLQEEAAAFRSSADAKANEFQRLNAELTSVKTEAQRLKAEMDTKSSENQRLAAELVSKSNEIHGLHVEL